MTGDRTFRLVHVIGARPHFMKLAPVYRALEAHGGFSQAIIHTGQHYDRTLSQQFIEEFNIPEPDINLMIGSATHTEQIGEAVKRLGKVFVQDQPHMVLVYGDTNSTAAGAIAAAKCNIPLGHVESGLREFNKSIPEEVNKLITDSVADLMFCPTATAVNNLNAEGKREGVYFVGDVVIDLLAERDWQNSGNTASEFNLSAGAYGLVTVHRAANTDNTDNLHQIVDALLRLEDPFLFPLHPRTRKALVTEGLLAPLQRANTRIVEPMGFWETQNALRNAKWVITDSGGIIKEAYFHKVPCIIVDRQTEWVEATDEGWARVSGPDTGNIIETLRTFIRPHQHSQFLGDGSASERIAAIIAEYLNANLIPDRAKAES